MNTLQGESRMPIAGDGETLGKAEQDEEVGKEKAIATVQEQWDKMCKRDLEELSRYEQSEAEQDVAGKNLLAAAAPRALMQAGIAALDEELTRRQQERHSPENPQALLLSTAASGQMFQDRDYRLTFARAERLDPEKAASRIASFFSFALEMFGQQALTRPIRPSDFEPADEEALRKGWIQLLLTRDKAGRRIVVLDDLGPEDLPLRNKMRVAFFLLQCAATDVESQSKGVHLVIQVFDPEKSLLLTDPATRAQFHRLLACSPVRFSCVHFCFPTIPGGEAQGTSLDSKAIPSIEKEEGKGPDVKGPILRLNSITESVRSLLGRDERVRTKLHTGSIIECHEKLSEYGIHPDSIPMTSTGRVKIKDHEKWIMIQIGRAQSQQQGQPFEIVECPTNMHILLVKGRHVARHEGNMRLRSILQERYDERNTSSRAQKIAITAEVMDTLIEEGYTFLVKNSGDFWVVPQRKVVLEKLAIAFRTVPRLKPLGS